MLASCKLVPYLHSLISHQHHPLYSGHGPSEWYSTNSALTKMTLLSPQVVFDIRHLLAASHFFLAGWLFLEPVAL